MHVREVADDDNDNNDLPLDSEPPSLPVNIEYDANHLLVQTT